ncbi:chemosensory receptor a [Plakobranchus ocellatus]|uniref:Chemosensory receptor a n=1 Tax=Plakobranchus ocellatus TaxID=259542 RepID=A0AAV4B0H1_9GAST|nr:chemosensory receptor a [Plakobranchus ocellatus]
MELSQQVTTVTAPAQQGLITQFQYNLSVDTLTSIQTFICMLGLITNIINIKTFLAMRAFDDGVTLTFLLLSVSDLFVCFVSTYICVSAFLISQESRWLSKLNSPKSIIHQEQLNGPFFPVEPTYIGIFGHNMFQIFNLITILLTIYLAVARCLCVMYPLKFRNIITVRKTLLVSTIFFLTSLGIRLPLITHSGILLKFDPRINATRYRLWVHPNRETIKDVLWISVDSPVCVGAQVTLSVCIVFMVKVLRAAVKFRLKASVTNNSKLDSNKSNEKLSTKETRIVKQLVLVSTIFIICNTPKILTFLAATIEPGFDLGGRYQNFYQVSVSATVLFDTLNSSVNMFVYYFYNSKFKSIFNNKSETTGSH